MIVVKVAVHRSKTPSDAQPWLATCALPVPLSAFGASKQEALDALKDELALAGYFPAHLKEV